MNRIEELIDTLEEYILKCKTQAFSSTKIICEREGLLEMVRELRARMPEELTRVQKIMANQDTIIKNAHEKADQIVVEANKKAEELVNNQKITKDAIAKANQIMQNATEKANGVLHDAIGEATHIRMGSINYTDALIANLQKFIQDSLNFQKQEATKVEEELQAQLDALGENRQELQRQMAQINGSQEELVAENTYHDIESTYGEDMDPEDDISDIEDIDA